MDGHQVFQQQDRVRLDRGQKPAWHLRRPRRRLRQDPKRCQRGRKTHAKSAR